ncbi:MAG: hypothetical protein AB1730_06800 [Myxococcota bacterium]|jgi:hypothetical protein
MPGESDFLRKKPRQPRSRQVVDSRTNFEELERCWALWRERGAAPACDEVVALVRPG